MLSQLVVTNRRGATLTLEMEEGDGGYQVADIDGLNPVKATMSSSSHAGRDGEIFQSARRGPRNITMKIDFDADFNPKSYTELRKDLYPYFMPKDQISIRFFDTTGLYVDIDAVVEEFDTKLFSQEQGVDISLMCFDPDFIDPRIVQLNGLTVNDLTTTEIDYLGTVEAGTVLTLNINRDLSEFSIYSTGEDNVLRQFNFAGALLEGDQLVISSLNGAKGITLIRGGVSSSFLYGRQAQSVWIEMVPGLNQFRVYAAGDPIPYVLEYVARYGGL